MKFILLALACLLVIAAAAPLGEDQYKFLFTRFVENYNKQYETNDFFGRYATFKKNLDKVVAHNAAGTESFSMAINQFADLSEVQFMQKMGFKPVASQVEQPCPAMHNKKVSVDYDYIDWRGKGVINEVKDQGSCGSCWAFSTAHSLESAYAIKTGQLLDLSEQQMVDCSGSTGNQGCNGGLMNNAYDYLMQRGGACLTKDYPYTARDGKCRDSECTPAVKVTGYDKAGSGNAALAKTLQRGPVAVALAATSDFQFYASGVFTKCSSTSLNHAVGLVAVVAAGAEAKIDRDAFAIRNSWGASWGSNGHIYLDATQENCLGLSVTAAKWNVIPTV